MTHKPISPEQLIQMHKQLVRIRRTEATLAERYKKQEMRTPTHFGLGQEAVPVGVCAALNRDDVAYSHHRSHNHFLAKGGSVYRLAAEFLNHRYSFLGCRQAQVSDRNLRAIFGKHDGCSATDAITTAGNQAYFPFQ